VIHFRLCCGEQHHFDGWFRSNDDYEKQRKSDLIACPVCGSVQVEKALMTPALANKTLKEKDPVDLAREQEQNLWQQWQQFARHIRKNADYVGKDFAEQARKIHFGEVKKRAIYGEAKGQEIVTLLDDGIDIMPLPPLPEDQN